MSSLESLKSAVSLHDILPILLFKPKSLAYILYKKPSARKYKHFNIPKRLGGMRTISAPYPDLMNLQKRLSDLLQNCISEINFTRKIESSLSHGFRRKHSIITNAAVHRKKRYVFNIDLENFFGTINFGRVRGFFISNRNFALTPKAATVLAQISCNDNVLPQGSPCSPVISNLIGHILDMRLAALAYKTGCNYSRYADDLTFSTNKQIFPTEVAERVKGAEHQWQAGRELTRLIIKTGFTINAGKTRMQYLGSRQEVTGLVVNAKINTRTEYRRAARAMTYRLLKTGKFQRKQTIQDDKGNLVLTEVDGTLPELNGILSFIDNVRVYNKQKDVESSGKGDSMETIYRRFLYFKDFYASSVPVIVCEGKTDYIYIKAAIRRLAGSYPQLAEKNNDGSISLKVRIYRYTKTNERILGLGGGTGHLVKFVKEYAKVCKIIDAPGEQQPVIILVDNDEGAKVIFSIVNEAIGEKPDGSRAFYPYDHNLYVVPTPLGRNAKVTMIEDFFPEEVRKRKVGGKSFNPSTKGFDNKTQYGKHVFAEHVVKKFEDKIDFHGFKPILDRIIAVINAHSK